MRDWLSMKAGQISYVDTSDTLYVPEYKHIMRVPGGWIVVYKDTPVYVPEPKHEGISYVKTIPDISDLEAKMRQR